MAQVLDKKRNKTTSFMLPALEFRDEKTAFKLLQYFGFINCYIDHKEHPVRRDDCLYLVFQPTGKAARDFGGFYDVYSKYPNFVEDYVVDTNVIVAVFRIRAKWLPTFEAFKASNYSQMSKEYAVLFKIPDLASGKVFLTPEYSIITKNPHYKQKLEASLSNPKSPVTIPDHLELLDKLNMDQEIFSYEYEPELAEVFSRES